MKTAISIAGVLLTALVLAATSDDEADKFLLPGNVIPTNYTLYLWTHIEKFDENNPYSFPYEGQIIITIKAVEDYVTSIALNSYDTIDIQRAVIEGLDAEPLLLSTSYDPETTILTLDVGKALEKNVEYKINILYNGVNRDTGQGFYRTTYDIDSGSGPRWLLATQLEPVSARTAWPCFDEPKYKAIWTIKVAVNQTLYDDGYRVLSNTDVTSIVTGNGEVTTVFAKTPLPVSSYLIAIVVSDYKPTIPLYFNSSYPDPSIGELKKFTTWGRPDLIEAGQGMVAQAAGSALMDVYTRNYNIGFGLNKLDQVAVANFGGGMENWGLVIYGDFLLIDDEGYQNSLVLIVAHELGHQWFGDLVTFHWWSDVWLNEGFATYTEYYGADQLELPGINVSEWKLMTSFVPSNVQYSLAYDVDDQFHPLTVEVYNPFQIGLLFDSVAYQKGGSILRMWRNIVGVDAFHKALNSYFLKTRESVSTPEILLQSLDEVVEASASDFEGQLPSQIFRKWHLESGYPVLSVNKSPNDSATYVLTQEKFVISDSSTAGTVWTIPISYSTSEQNSFDDLSATQWFRAEDESTEIKLPGSVEWIVVNNQESGYYRVNYDQENWDALNTILNNSETLDQIHEINRLQIVDDASYLVQSIHRDYLSYDTFLNITTYLKHENEYYVWVSAINNLKYLNNMIAENSTIYPLFKKYLTSLLLPHYNRLTPHEKPTDRYLDKKLRSLIVDWMCKMDNANCIMATQSLLHKHLVLRSKINSGARRAAYCTGIRFGDSRTWRLLLKEYLTSKDMMDKSDLLAGLGCATDPAIVKEFLGKPITRKSEIPIERLPDVLHSVQEGSPVNARVAFNFIKDHFEEIAKKFPGQNTLGKLLRSVAGSLGTEQDWLKMKQLIWSMEKSSQREVKTAIISAKKALSLIERNKGWIKYKQDSVYQWLKAHY